MTPEMAKAERKKADMKAREELRNAVRYALTEAGISSAMIKRMILEMTGSAVEKAINHAFDTERVDALVLRIVMDRVKRDLSTAKLNTTLEQLVVNSIKNEAAAYARKYIEDNINVSISTADWG